MNTELIRPVVASLVRHGLTAAGVTSMAGQEHVVVGAILTLVGLAWSIWQKKKTTPAPQTPPRVQTPLFILAACLFIAPGCTTLSTPTANVIADRAAYRITERALAKHPDWLPHFETARAELIALQSQPTLDALAIVEILGRMPASALDADDAVIVLDGLYITILVAGDPALTPDGEAALRNVLDGLINGMNRRLGKPA